MRKTAVTASLLAFAGSLATALPAVASRVTYAYEPRPMEIVGFRTSDDYQEVSCGDLAMPARLPCNLDTVPTYADRPIGITLDTAALPFELSDIRMVIQDQGYDYDGGIEVFDADGAPLIEIGIDEKGTWFASYQGSGANSVAPQLVDVSLSGVRNYYDLTFGRDGLITDWRIDLIFDPESFYVSFRRAPSGRE